MMVWVLAVLVVLLIGAVAVLVAGRGPAAGLELAPAYDDRPDAFLPEGRPLTGDDLRRLRLSTSLRGYRAAEVDELLHRLADELDRRPAKGGVTRPAEGDPGSERGSGRLS